MSSTLYIEGGGGRQDLKDLKIACRKGFRLLLESMGYSGRMPKLISCGSRDTTFSDLRTACKNRQDEYVAMIIDSEEAVSDPEKTWDHLKARDGWDRPDKSCDEDVLFMTTCMETWITSDREALKEYYSRYLQESSLPSLSGIEGRNRHKIQEMLKDATRNGSKPYSKGKASFELVGKPNLDSLMEPLVSFRRMKRILDEKLSN